MKFKHLTTIILLFIFAIPGFTQDKPAYVLFNGQGKKVKFTRMIRTLNKGDVVLFGESHNNPIAHWLQLELVKEMKKTKNLVLGAEMFEADNQKPLNDYLNGSIKAKGLDTLARLWPNYKTDYAPLVNFAKDNKLKFIATNVPRKYANQVYKKGMESLESLSEQEKKWMAPLPFPYDSTLPGYKKIKEQMPGHMGDNLPKAQAIKDATMAYFILKNFNKGDFFIHFNGSYHSENYEGIVWYLKKERPDLKYYTITTVSQSDCGKLLDENKNKADFIISVDEDMTATY